MRSKRPLAHERERLGAGKLAIQETVLGDDRSLGTRATRDARIASSERIVLGGRTGSLECRVEDGAIARLHRGGREREVLRIFTDWRGVGLKARNAFLLPGGAELTAGLDTEAVRGDSRETRPAGAGPMGDHRCRDVAPHAALARTFGADVEVTPSAGVRWNRSSELGSAWSAQMGMTVASRADAGVAPDVTPFHDDVKDAFCFAPAPPPLPRWANTGACTACGAELSRTLEPVEALSLSGGASFTETAPAAVPYAPRRTSSGGALSPGLVAFLGSESIAGSDDACRPGYPMPGTAIRGGASLRF